jgi:hypothetical protein
LFFELLEDRRLLATFVVNSTANDDDSFPGDGICDTANQPEADPPIPPSGICTLRAASSQAVSSPGNDRIEFNIPVAQGVIPQLERPVFDGNGSIDVDGTTQPGGLVEIHRNSGSAVFLSNGGSTIRGLVLTGGSIGITIQSDNNVIVGNYIGLRPDGSTVDGNSSGGILVNGSGNRIGGTTAADRNVISGNGNGIEITPGGGSEPSNNTILGNYIGTNAAGTEARGNTASGILILNSNGNTIGGASAGAANVIAANRDGVVMQRSSSNNVVKGNLIGTDAAGTTKLGNTSTGVAIQAFFLGDLPTGNVIGGPTEADRNVIAGNEFGVRLSNGADANTVEGNYVGLNATGTAALPNVTGVEVLFSSKNVIGGAQPNIISGNTTGIRIIGSTATDNLVAGNRIGTNPAGTAPLGNDLGVLINGAPANCIGGPLPVSEAASSLCVGGVPGTQTITGNLISGNATYGVHIANNTAANNLVQANKIGTDITGTIADPDNTHNSGDELGNKFDGVFLSAGAHDNTIGGTTSSRRNLISGNIGDGIIITGVAGNVASNNLVLGNFIGTDVTGNNALPNLARGIHIDQHATGNIIGGETPNLISGNKLDGIIIALATATENIVDGNRIGTNLNDTANVSNGGNGVYILNAPANRIGGFDDGTSTVFNVISGNNKSGILIEGPSASANLVGNNLIGVDRTASQRRRNLEDGIRILNAPNNRIGSSLSGDEPISGNTISGNTSHGIRIDGATAIGNVVGGNRIGTNAQGAVSNPPALLGNSRGIFIRNAGNNFIGGLAPDSSENGTQLPANIIAGNGLSGVEIQGDTAMGNRVQRNSIFSNGGLGIDLGGDGVTPNDELDADESPNRLQNFPAISGIDVDGQVTGTLHSTPDSTLTIDVYLSPEPDPSGNGEGKTWIQEIEVETDDEGDATFEFDLDLEMVAQLQTITVTATDATGNTSEFSGPLRLADLRVALDTLSIGQIERRGALFILPYRATVTNTGTASADDALVRFTGNGQLLAEQTITLNACTTQTCPMEELFGEWDVTSLFPQGELGAPVTLQLVVEADPGDAIPEFPPPLGTNSNLVMDEIEDVDPRPQIKLIESQFQPGHTFLPGVSLPNRFDIQVDWNGNLDNSQIGADIQASVRAFVNGHVVRTRNVTDPSNDTSLTIDLGNDLETGANVVHFRADTDLHFFFSEYSQLEFDQARGIDWLNTALVTVSGVPTSSAHNQTAIYKAGIGFPTVTVQGFFGIPVDQIGMAGGRFGPKIPQITIRVEIRSDRTGKIQGEAKLQAEVAGKSVGADDFGGIGGKASGKLTGDVVFDGFIPTLRKGSVTLRLEGFITTPKIPFPPPASFIQAQGKLSLAADVTADIVHRTGEDKLVFGGDVVLGLEPTLEAIFSIGRDGVASVEVSVGGTLRGEYDLDEDPCFNRSATAEVFARLKATFLVFSAQKTFRFPFAVTGCGAGGEGESLFVNPIVSSEFGLIPRYVLATNEEGEAATEGLPAVAYPYAKPALARHTDGTMTLVYVNEDPTKADAQHLEIFASRFDGNTWSAPIQVSDDTLIDDAPTVAYDANGRAVAVWTRLKNPITDPANANPAALLGDLEIVFSVHDTNTNTWSMPAALTDNSDLDFMPQLHADAAGNLMAAWVRDTGNDSPIFPDDAAPLGADIVSATWDGTAWSTPIVAVAGAKTNATPQFAVNGNEAVLVYSEDTDADVATLTDRELRFSSFDGSVWSAATVLAGAGDGVRDVSPRVAYDSTGRAVVTWVKTGVSIGEADSDVTDQLVFLEIVDGAPTTPARALDVPAIGDSQLLIDSQDNPIVIWQGLSGSGADIFYSVFDRSSSEWSEPIQFTDDADLEWWFSPFINDDGELEIIHLSREVGSEPAPADDGSGAEGEPGDMIMVPTFEGSSLQSEAVELGHDLSVVALTSSVANPEPGSVVRITATVFNSGDFSAPGSTIALTDDGVAIGTNLSVPALRAGETAEVVFDWTVPLGATTPHTLVAQVDPDLQLDETDEANNDTSLVMLQPDLIVSSVHTVLENDTITVQVEVLNQGGSPTSGDFEVALRQDNPDSGIALGLQTVNVSLARNESTTLTFTIDNALVTLGTLHTGFVVVDADDAISELDETNNTSFGALDPQRVALATLPPGVGPFRVRRDLEDVVVTQQNATELLREPLVALQRLTLPATPRADHVIIDFTAGDPVPGRGITFGGADGDDTLALVGGGMNNVTFHGGSGRNSLLLFGSGIELDLTNPNQNRLTSVGMIDLAGNGDNGITLSLEAVRDISPANNELKLLANIGDVVAIGVGWTLTGTEIASDHFFRVLEQQGVKLRLSGPAHWNNPVDDLDVNNDGTRSPIDALIIINELNLAQSPFRDASSRATDPFILNSDGDPANDFDNFYRDTNRDGFFSPLDVLVIINYLNSPFANTEGEGLFAISTDANSRQQAVDEAISVFRKRAAGGAIHLLDNAWRLTATRTPSTTHPAERFALAVDELALSDELYDLFRDDLP